MSSMSAAEDEVSALGGWGIQENTVLTHVKLTLNGCPAQIVEMEPASADLLADSQAQLPQL